MPNPSPLTDEQVREWQQIAERWSDDAMDWTWRDVRIALEAFPSLLAERRALKEENEWLKAVNKELFPYQQRAIEAEKRVARGNGDDEAGCICGSFGGARHDDDCPRAARGHGEDSEVRQALAYAAELYDEEIGHQEALGRMAVVLRLRRQQEILRRLAAPQPSPL